MNASALSLLWLLLIVALIPAALWLLRRSPMGASLAGVPGLAAPVRPVGSHALSPQQRLVTVEVGEGAQRVWLVLGVTPQQITTLHVLTDPPALPAAAAAPGLPQAFGPLLAKLRRDGQGGPDAR